MTDLQIRDYLIEEKRETRRERAKRRLIGDIIGGFVAFGAFPFMLALLGTLIS